MLAYNGSVLKVNGSWINHVDPYNPLDLPPHTMRFQFSNSSFNPLLIDRQWFSTSTWTQVSSDPNIWDYTNSDAWWWSDFSYVFDDSVYNTGNVSVLGANTTGVTRMDALFSNCPSLISVPLFDTSSVHTTNSMFNECTSLTSVPLYDTSNVTNVASMFSECTSLTSVPLFDTSNVTNTQWMFSGCTSLTVVPLFDTSSSTQMLGMFDNCTSLIALPLFDTSNATDTRYMFRNCTAVESGALALYNQASTQTTLPAMHSYMFTNCGLNTVTGAAELAQIPTSWGGTAT